MKVIHLHQRYRYRGGEDAMVDATVSLLCERGIDARLITRDSSVIKSFARRARALASGIYSFAAAHEVQALIAAESPDLVHVHNLHPTFSPSVIAASRRAGVPVVMTLHNYRLVCPLGMHMRHGRVCELCAGGREYWCLLTNCRGNLPESFAYALRNVVHRKLGLYRDHVSMFVAVSRFVRDRLVREGLPADKVTVVPNMVTIAEKPADPATGEYAAFIGRFSPQKGLAPLLNAARRCSVPLRLAGDWSPMPDLRQSAPSNVEFLGGLNEDQRARFYQRARFVVVPSEALEPFGLVAVEAMNHGLPVIASRIGGLTEIVQDGVTGLLVEPGNSEELAAAMCRLWESPELCRRLGAAGRERAMREYNRNVYFERLMQVYQRALEAEMMTEAAIN